MCGSHHSAGCCRNWAGTIRVRLLHQWKILRPQGEVSQAQLFEPLAQFTLALAKRAPLALFIDDLQWSDSATLDLLQYAIRRWQSSATR